MNRLLTHLLLISICSPCYGQSGEDLCAGFHLIEGTADCVQNTVTVNSDYAIIQWNNFDISSTLNYKGSGATVNYVFGFARITGAVESQGPFALITLGNSGTSIDVLGTITAPDILISANSTARLDVVNATKEFIEGGNLQLATDNNGTSTLTIDGGHIEATATDGSVRLVARTIDLEREATVSSLGEIEFASASNVTVTGSGGLIVENSSAGGSTRIGGDSEISGSNVKLLAYNGDSQEPPVRAIVNRGTINATSPEGRVFVKISGAGGAFLHNGDGNQNAVINGSLELGEGTVLTGNGLINPSGSDPAPMINVIGRINDLRNAKTTNEVAENEKDEDEENQEAKKDKAESKPPRTTATTRKRKKGRIFIAKSKVGNR